LNPRLTQSWIGVFESPDSDGRVRVGRVVPESPAEEAGIRAGDELIAFAGIGISDFDALRRRVEMHEPGETVKVQISRNGESFELELEIGSRSEREIQR
jgi:S1-C subfamily serine protease